MLKEGGPMFATQPTTTIKEGGVPPGVHAVDLVHPVSVDLGVGLSPQEDRAMMLEDLRRADPTIGAEPTRAGAHTVNGEAPGQKPAMTDWEKSTLAARTSDMDPQKALKEERPGSYPSVEPSHPMAGKLQTRGRVFSNGK